MMGMFFKKQEREDLENLDCIKKERESIGAKKITFTEKQLKAFKEDQVKITNEVKREVHKKNGGQHPLTPPHELI